MAVLGVNKVGTSSTANTIQYDSGSYTPAASRLLIATIIRTSTAGNTSAATLLGNGLTWEQLADSGQSGGRRVSKHAALTGASPSGGFLRATFAASQTGCIIIVDEYDGGELSSVAAAAINATVATGSGNEGLVTLPAFADAGNGVHATFCHAANEDSVAGDGFTGLVLNGKYASPVNGGMSEWRADNDTSVTATWPTSSSWIGIAVELVAADAGGGEVTVNLDLAVETDTAHDLTVENPISIILDLATETDTALNLSVANDAPVSVVLDLAQETDAALELTIENPISVTLDLATEFDSALDLSVANQEPTMVGLDLAQETDTALDLVLEHTVILDLATEIDTARDFQVSIEGSEVTVVLDIATETDSAFDLSPVLDAPVSAVLDLAAEVDTALELIVDQEPDVDVGLGLAIEIDSAFDLNVSIAVVVILDLAIEVDIAHALGVVVESDLLRPDFLVLLGFAEHRWSANAAESRWSTEDAAVNLWSAVGVAEVRWSTEDAKSKWQPEVAHN